MKFGVVVFPGTWSDMDCYHVLNSVLHQEVEYLWHKERDLKRSDCIVLPGGFSYGDYLRCGAIARFSPIMEAVVDHAEHGGLVIGICNGFQVLCESGLLPGALLRNNHLQFRCQWTHLRTENSATPFTVDAQPKQVLHVPISHGEGNYYADGQTLVELERHGQVVFRYCDANGVANDAANPNGALHNIAGIINRRGNVLGMMPHPERCCEANLGGTDGLAIFGSIVTSATRALGVA
ncbi:MAG: phosphoribosylformylglycinamidine synthase subunit PurQ [Dehalococcoidia bacterium]|nr:phosphoribosylformylglycinamidine synthase subunit PurQ [Dehalococcoidia bacterium]